MDRKLPRGDVSGNQDQGKNQDNWRESDEKIRQDQLVAQAPKQTLPDSRPDERHRYQQKHNPTVICSPAESPPTKPGIHRIADRSRNQAISQNAARSRPLRGLRSIQPKNFDLNPSGTG